MSSPNCERIDCEKQSQFCIARHNQEEKPPENVHSSINALAMCTVLIKGHHREV